MNYCFFIWWDGIIKGKNNDSGLLDSVEEVARMEKQKHRFHVKNSCEMERKIGIQQKCSKNSIWTNWAMGYQVLSTFFSKTFGFLVLFG